MAKTKVKIKGSLGTSPCGPMPCAGTMGILTTDHAPEGKACIEFRKKFFTTDGNEFDPQGSPIQLYIPTENYEVIEDTKTPKPVTAGKVAPKTAKPGEATPTIKLVEKPKKVHTDLAKVDIHTDFGDFQPMFSTPDDIERYVIERKLEAPVLLRGLELRRGTLLGLTPTEKEFYFERLFSYIYDVYRIPVPETYRLMDNWIIDYIEGRLVLRGMEGIKERAYDSLKQHFDVKIRLFEFMKKHPKIKEKREPEEINCHRDIHPEYADKPSPKAIDWFYIKTDQDSIQPYTIGEEAYALVQVFSNRVYICGCDDMSWTLNTKTKAEALEFALFLKCAAPVWNFSFPKQIHRELEFTN